LLYKYGSRNRVGTSFMAVAIFGMKSNLKKKLRETMWKKGV
jgi:hypothetical protein